MRALLLRAVGGLLLLAGVALIVLQALFALSDALGHSSVAWSWSAFIVSVLVAAALVNVGVWLVRSRPPSRRYVRRALRSRPVSLVAGIFLCGVLGWVLYLAVSDALNGRWGSFALELACLVALGWVISTTPAFRQALLRMRRHAG